MHYRRGGARSTHLNPLVILQKRPVRIIANSNCLALTAPLFHQCGFLNLKEIYKINLAVFFYKNRLEHNFTRTHSYDNRRAIELCPIYQRLNSTQSSIASVGPIARNEIPTEIK